MSSRRRIRIAVIGGLTRATDLWTNAGRALGVELEHHDGRSQGRRADDIASLIRRADLVVIITDPNSHNGVTIARRAALAAEKPHRLVKHLRPNGLAELINEMLAALPALGDERAPMRPALRAAV
jgi:hypothetical protein